MSDEQIIKKRPAFQFYPGDWRKDVELRACSLAARGLWIDLMCVMHDCEPYGHLVLNGMAMNPAKIAGQIGVTPVQVKKLLDELIENGVARKTSDGTIFSKRMVDDEHLRNVRASGGKAGSEHGIKGAEHGVKGGRPSVDKGGFGTPLDDLSKPPPSSSSSSSSASSLSQSEVQANFAACGAALKRAGVNLATVSTSDPVYRELVKQGMTPEELEPVAKEAVDKRIAKPLPWICTVVMDRRQRAADVKLAPAVKAKTSAHSLSADEQFMPEETAK